MNTYKLGIVSTDWDRLPERTPMLLTRDFMGYIFALTLIIPFWIFSAFLIFVVLKMLLNLDIFLNLVYFLIFILLLVVVVVLCRVLFYFTKKTVLSFFEDLRCRDEFMKNQSQTTAKILARRVKPEYDQYGTHYSYQLQLKFTPIGTTVGHSVINVQASIGKRFYESLENRDAVNITYAVDDPKILLIEGE